jgi:hypothetical protein
MVSAATAGNVLLLEDVKEWISYKCLCNLLLHILQKEKIATKIAATNANKPQQYNNLLCNVRKRRGILQSNLIKSQIRAANTKS